MLDFGARGDGANDDATAIQAAINAARRDRWDSVFLPLGHVFTVGKPLILPGGVLIFSMGGLNHAPATIETIAGYSYPNVIQNFRGENFENPAPDEDTSYYVGLRDLSFSIRGSTIKNVVHVAHVWENSLFENLSFGIEHSRIDGAIFKHSANAAPQGAGDGFVIRNTNLPYVRGTAVIRRLLDVEAASAVQIVGGNWVVGFCDGRADPVR